MAKRNRIIAFALAAIVIFVMAFSLYIVAAEAHHDCCGEHCPVCELIAVCENNIKTIALILVFVTLIAALSLSYRVSGTFRGILCYAQTPITLKVKLTN